MFEQYDLLHFDIKNPNDIDRNLSFQMGKADYQITGSFDFLLPHFSNNDMETSFKEKIFLQSFCVMDNDKGYYTRRSDFESLLLSYTFDGCGHLSFDGRTFSVRSGEGFMIDCRRPHEYKTDGSHWKHMDIHFWGAQALLLYQYFQELKSITFTCPLSEMVHMTEKLLAAHNTYSPFRDLYIANSLSDLLCEVLRQTEDDGFSAIPEIYRNIIHYMETNYTQPVTLDMLSDQFHISKYHLSRQFHKYTGFSPKEYLIKLRINHALILLSGSDLSIEETASRSGFSNMSNFIEQIKKHTGMLPSELRKIRR